MILISGIWLSNRWLKIVTSEKHVEKNVWFVLQCIKMYLFFVCWLNRARDVVFCFYSTHSYFSSKCTNVKSEFHFKETSLFCLCMFFNLSIYFSLQLKVWLLPCPHHCLHLSEWGSEFRKMFSLSQFSKGWYICQFLFI